MAQTPGYAWMNGELVPWENATIHLRTDAVLYGSNVFEGIRAYFSEDKEKLFIFKNDEHMDRLFNTSMKILRMQSQWTAADLTRGIIDLLRACKFEQDVHIRPMMMFGSGEAYSWDPAKIEVIAAISAIEWPAKPTLFSGVDICVSSWRRIGDETLPPRVKAGPNYLQARYAMMDARGGGYDQAVLLNERGKVAEGPGSCFMMVRNGKVITPPVTAGILESVTRFTLMELFEKEMGLEVVEREVDRTELYIADEAFFCGTGHEIQPVNSVDRYPVGKGEPGPIVKEMQKIYFDIARGKNPKYSQWLTPVY